MYIIKVKKQSSIGMLKETHTSYVHLPTKSFIALTDYGYNAHLFATEEDANDYILTVAYDENIISMEPIEVSDKYHIKYDNNYVRECDLEYLVKCTKEESIFNKETALSLKKQCPNRIKLEEVK